MKKKPSFIEEEAHPKLAPESLGASKIYYCVYKLLPGSTREKLYVKQYVSWVTVLFIYDVYQLHMVSCLDVTPAAWLFVQCCINASPPFGKLRNKSMCLLNISLPKWPYRGWATLKKSPTEKIDTPTSNFLFFSFANLLIPTSNILELLIRHFNYDHITGCERQTCFV